MILFKVKSLILLSVFIFINGDINADQAFDSFIGEPAFDRQRLFDDQRYPNIVVTNKGTVIVVWGNSGVAIRRSEDGGKSWGDSIKISEKGYNVEERLLIPPPGIFLFSLKIDSRQPR